MQKIRLDLEALDVESFAAVAPEADERGTVIAHSGNTNCGWTSCLIPCPGTVAL